MHGVPPPVLGPLAQNPIVGALAKLSKHRAYQTPVRRILGRDPSTADVAQRMSNCAGRLALAIELQDDTTAKALVEGGYFCQARLCPFCEWRRTRVWQRRLINGLGELHKDKPKLRAIFVTLTVRNVPVHRLRETIKDMHTAWGRYSRCSFFPSSYWLRRTEITLGRPSFADDLPRAPILSCSSLKGSQGPSAATQVQPSPLLLEGVNRSPAGPQHDRRPAAAIPAVGGLWAHPHIHALVLVPPRYFAADYVPHAEWRDQWQMALRADYSPVVDVRKATAKKGVDDPLAMSTAAALEAAKYIVKSSDIAALGDLAPEMHHQIRGLRMIAASSKLGQYIKTADISEAEMLDTSAVAASPNPLFHCVAEWQEFTQEYIVGA